MIINILGFRSRYCAWLFYLSNIEHWILQLCLLPCNYSNNYKVIITKHNVATSGGLHSFRLPTCRARSWPAVEEQEADRGESEPQLAVGAFWRPSSSSLLLRGQASASITSTLGSTASQSTSATTTGWSGLLHKASLTPGTLCKSWTILLYMLTSVLHSGYERCKPMNSLQEHLWGWSVWRILRWLPRRLLSSRWGKRPLT